MAFMIPGPLGSQWLIAWRWLYRPPERHPRISEAERQMIFLDTGEPESSECTRMPWRDLWKLPQAWGTIFARALTDPVWFFVTDWFPIYLVAKGISLKSGLLAV